MAECSRTPVQRCARQPIESDLKAARKPVGDRPAHRPRHPTRAQTWRTETEGLPLPTRPRPAQQTRPAGRYVPPPYPHGTITIEISNFDQSSAGLSASFDWSATRFSASPTRSSPAAARSTISASPTSIAGRRPRSPTPHPTARGAGLHRYRRTASRVTRGIFEAGLSADRGAS